MPQPPKKPPPSSTPSQQVLRVRCPNLMCQRILAVPVMARGKLVRCRSCGMTLRIPMKPETAPPTPASPKGEE